MHRAKKYFLSFLFVLSLGILQFNMLPVISPALADETLYKNQNLLQEATANNYGSKPLDVKVVALNVLKTLLSFIALIMVALLIAAGFKYMASNGNEAEMKEAMNKIQALVIGLLIILASWGIVTYVIKWLICATTTTNSSCASIW